MVKALRKRMSTKRRASMKRFGPVSTIDTAPVAIGNSIRGSAPVVRQVSDGMRVVGRDFAFACNSTASNVTGWELIGGMPLTPSVLASSGLRAFVQSYANFKINNLAFHYITSSPTSQAGDVCFYYGRDRLSPLPDTSNSNFLPYILSDPHTVLGPQWVNHTAMVTPAPDWKSTNYGVNTDINEEAPGEIIMYSKTNASNSPGYVIMDYDITFRELSVNPRAGYLPVSRGSYAPITLGASVIVSLNDPIQAPLAGQDISGATATEPSGKLSGDVYKLVFSVAASTVRNAWSNTTLSTLAKTANGTNLTFDDGTTLYAARIDATGNYRFYLTKSDAETQTNYLRHQVGATCTYFISGLYSLVSVTDTTTQFSY